MGEDSEGSRKSEWRWELTSMGGSNQEGPCAEDAVVTILGPQGTEPRDRKSCTINSPREGGASASCGICWARSRGPGAGLCSFWVLSRRTTKDRRHQSQVSGAAPREPEDGGTTHPFSRTLGVSCVRDCPPFGGHRW